MNLAISNVLIKQLSYLSIIIKGEERKEELWGWCHANEKQ